MAVPTMDAETPAETTDGRRVGQQPPASTGAPPQPTQDGPAIEESEAHPS